MLSKLKLLVIIGFIITACSKGGGNNNPPNSCSGVTIIVTATVVNPTSGNNGSISASATGGNGFTFSLNNGTFQSSGNFTGLTAGSYSVTAKNSNGCTGSSNFTLATQCSGVTINVSSVATANIPCQPANGSLSITASGGTNNFTYSLNNGSFQTSNLFNGLVAGSYSIVARDANGCEGTVTTSITTANAGPLFNAVRTLIQTNCALTGGCHGDTQQPLFTDPCNIIANKLIIKQRAVDGIPTSMPPTGLLPQAERQKITDWLNAGGQYIN